MHDSRTWREMLGALTRDPLERQRIAQELGVSSVTLIRWANGVSNPRMDNLRSLLDVLPTYRDQLYRLIEQEFPLFLGEDEKQKEEFLEIPTTFYAQVLTIHTTSPLNLRSQMICNLILQQLCRHLDPTQRKMSAVVALCVPPDAQEKLVRSLRVTMWQENRPLSLERYAHTMFLGAESQAGYAIISGRMETLHDLEQDSFEGSVLSCPIISSGSVAGVLIVSSTQPNDFTSSRSQLIQRYTDLLALAFAPPDFYSFDQIKLGLMPSYQEQEPYLKSFQQRVRLLLIDAAREQRLLPVFEAEAIVWKELERELLEISLHHFLKKESGNELHTSS